MLSKVWSLRFKRVRRDGSDIWLEASYNPVFDDTGELYKAIKFATNITEQMSRELATVETSKFAYDTSLKTDSAAKRGIEVIQTTTATMGQLASSTTVANGDIIKVVEDNKLLTAKCSEAD